MNRKITIHFLGGAGTVTGSKFLISTEKKNILVDCGLFQGLKSLRLLNWERFSLPPSQIHAVLLTHGHLDHCGYLPRLVKQGFKGKIHCTAPTVQISRIILEDSAKVQEEDAEWANLKGFSKHHPALPLYSLKDVEETMPLFVSHPADTWTELEKGIRFRFRYNGHILGATFIELSIFNKLFVFSGDIGRESDPLMFPPAKPEAADILFLESTYGDRIHPLQPEARLAELITIAAEKRGTIIIPGFAVERMQLLMYLFWQLSKKGRIPSIPVFMDSPMGTNVLNVFPYHSKWHRLSAGDIEEMRKAIRLVTSWNETLEIAKSRSAKIIIAGSGMGTGGRVLTYFQHYLPDPKATVILVGFQAEGTRGRLMLEGAPEVKIYGKYYPVRSKIENLLGLSAHADQKELLQWLGKLEHEPEKIFIVHGEPTASDALRVKIKDTYGWESTIPALNSRVEIHASIAPETFSEKGPML